LALLGAEGVVGPLPLGSGLSIVNGFLVATGGGGGGGTSAPTNLSVTGRTAAGLTIASSTGADAEVPLATAELAGLQSAADKAKIDTSASVALSAGLVIALG
jgi:hypothetical protein